MGKLKNLYCIMGRSGSGKTTVVNQLEEKFGYKVLKSYTTRKPRHEGDNDHTYVSMDEYVALPNKVATCFFNNNWYCATAEQIEESGLYVVDTDGIVELRETYKGDKKIIAIQLDVSMEVCLERMLYRGDSEDAAWERLRHDYTAFKHADILSDYVIKGEEDMLEVIRHIIDYEESEEETT